MPAFLRNLTYEGVPVWRHAHIVQWTLQIVSGVAAVALVIWFLANIGLAIDSRNIPFGFGFLDTEYQTPIGEHFIPYDPSDTYLQAAADCIQLHGGIGFTWDNDTHLWFKRAKSSEVLFGDATYHRERMLEHWPE